MKAVIQFLQHGREFSKTVELSSQPSVNETVIVDNHKLVVKDRIHVANYDLHLMCACYSNMGSELLMAGGWKDTTYAPFAEEPKPAPAKGRKAK